MTNSSSVTAAVMTSVGVPAYVVAEVFYIQFTQRACGLSALVLMGHDIVVTSEREIKYFWKRGWSIHKVLYFLMRYFSVVAQLVSVYSELYLALPVFLVADTPSLLQPYFSSCESLVIPRGCHLVTHISYNRCTPTLPDAETTNLISHSSCDFWLRWQVATSMLQLWFTQAVLCQIVRALYLNSRILLLIWFFFAVEMGTQIYFTVVAIPETAVYPFYPNKSVKQCGPRQGAPQVHLLWRYWLPALVFELVIFGFAFVRLWSTVADFGTGSFNLFKVRRKKATLMELILRDAMLYFVS
ncbi:hypothetical protein SISNIDRAFT_162028 [Sistotremastrum niveocremeum HHB9708]|uniref:DUF6533 domain-containing protein n=1 Tax=Sistotremastrum niveocremeum HHB9708 TaxID=1314777 RepID=A0A164SM07_9AGAM|nr:hypothetical protein SISNIDRAFT_162028 [Sistotremastrum niveocremeum HHB9708]